MPHQRYFYHFISTSIISGSHQCPETNWISSTPGRFLAFSNSPPLGTGHLVRTHGNGYRCHRVNRNVLMDCENIPAARRNFRHQCRQNARFICQRSGNGHNIVAEPGIVLVNKILVLIKSAAGNSCGFGRFRRRFLPYPAPTIFGQYDF